jgi:MOSC domain-containing protein YiiM
VTEPAVGRLIGLARRPHRRAPMETVTQGLITPDGGLEGDHKGPRFPHRRITVLARESWETALADLSDLLGPLDLAWTARRANLLTEGVALPRAAGGLIRIGPVLLEVTGQTVPCAQMDAAHPGLRKALHPDWRGGVTCAVLEGGEVSLGAPVEIVFAPTERRIRLP